MDRTYKFVDRSHGGAVQLVSVFSPNAVNELRFQVPSEASRSNRFEATGTGPAITIPVWPTSAIRWTSASDSRRQRPR